jgi:hypothetical protein
MVTAGADTEPTPQIQIVYDPIYDHIEGDVASCIVLLASKGAAERAISA